MALPDDLVDYIFSFLQSDFATLQTCAKSHPTLCTPAERYMYASVSLQDLPEFALHPSDMRASEFAQILAKRPEIATYVRTLAVHLDEDPENDLVTASHYDIVASIFPALLGLTTVTLAAYRLRIPWHALPETFRQAFLHILHIPSMKRVYIDHVSFLPLCLFDNCKNIRVCLGFCEVIEFDKEHMKDLSYRPVFEHLSVSYCGDKSLPKVTAWVQMHDLYSLVFRDAEYRFRVFLPPLLVACSNSLTNLELDICASFQTSYTISQSSGMYMHNDAVDFPFTLVDLVRLERLTFFAYLQIPLNTASFESPVPAITKLVHTASLSLKQIFLKFDIWKLSEPNSEVTWSAFIPLAAKCLSRSITVHISLKPTTPMSGDHLPQSNDLLPISSCAGLVSYVDKGVVVVSEG